MSRHIPWTEADTDALIRMKEEGLPRRQIAERMGRSYGSVANKLQSLGIGAAAVKAGPLVQDEKFEHSVKGDSASVTSVSERIRTPADALAYAEIDTDVWSVERQTVNSWEAAAKTDDGIQAITLWQVKLQLKRKASKYITDGLDAIFKKMESHKPVSPTPRKKSTKDPHMLEVSLFDSHFGKLCWYSGKEFGSGKAAKLYLDAVDELLEKTSAWNVELVLYPIGNDFFHVDSWKNTTTKGTPVDADAPFQQVFEIGVAAVINAIDRCLSTAPVKLLWVPGNHDLSTSWYLMRVLSAWYKSNKNVEVDIDPRPRKYIHYGVNLIGFTHGNEEQHRDLPAIMAGEVPKEWANSSWREFHTGHFHRAKQIVVKHTDEFGGVRVRTLPSLSGTDSWHYQKGYVNNQRAAEAYLWNKKDGYAGHLSANIRNRTG